MKEPDLITIDPGIGGGMAAFVRGDLITAAFTTEGDACQWLRQFDPATATAWIEEVHSSPQMGVRSAFTFGRNFGFWLGALGALQIPVRMVKPQVWQRGIAGVGRLQGPERKSALRAEAQRRFPHLRITQAVADAILMNDWARSQMTQ